VDLYLHDPILLHSVVMDSVTIYVTFIRHVKSATTVSVPVVTETNPCNFEVETES